MESSYRDHLFKRSATLWMLATQATSIGSWIFLAMVLKAFISNYIMDPHGAVGYAGLKKYFADQDFVGVFLETAHPAKFLEVVEETLHRKLEIPEKLQQFMKGERQVIPLSADFIDFKKVLEEIL
jgi:threonine synthase